MKPEQKCNPSELIELKLGLNVLVGSGRGESFWPHPAYLRATMEHLHLGDIFVSKVIAFNISPLARVR